MSIEGVDEAQDDLVWDPPWNQNMISEAGPHEARDGLMLARLRLAVASQTEASWH